MLRLELLVLLFISLAAGPQGFEPRTVVLETTVLPIKTMDPDFLTSQYSKHTSNTHPESLDR